MELFDSHCHLQDAAFADDAGAVIERARRAGVAGMLVCGYDEASNIEALRLAEGNPEVFAAVGFQPHEAVNVTGPMLETLRAQAGLPGVTAVGEIGLDFHWDGAPHPLQRVILEAQLFIAAGAGKPVSVHSRDAEEAIDPHLAAYAAASPLVAAGRAVGVMHCFGGTLEQAMRYVELGFLISVPCAVTYPKNDEARRIAAGVPLDRLLVESDAPYLPPQTMRGKRNEPAFISAAVEAIAAARAISAAEVAAATTANARAVFGVPVREAVAAW